MMSQALAQLKHEIAGCRLCAQHLPLGPRPVIRGNSAAKLLIIGQAPGSRVHKSGIPWDDASGDRLRGWLGLEKDIFYNEDLIAMMPMGFCYPGRATTGGDLPPRPECAPKWHPALRESFRHIQTTLLIGSFAQKYYLKKQGEKNMTENIRQYKKYLSQNIFPLPHPSWRTRAWQQKNPFFESDTLPALRQEIQRCLY